MRIFGACTTTVTGATRLIHLVLLSLSCFTYAEVEEVGITASGETESITGGASTTKDPHVQRAWAVFEWVNNHKDGFIDLESQIIQKDKQGHMGIFAGKDIPKNTVLARIPFDLFIKSDNPKDSGQLPCGTVQNLARELQKGNASNYAPYINYLLHESNHSIPSSYSQQGKALLLEILDYNPTTQRTAIPPKESTSWIDPEWIQYCHLSKDERQQGKTTDIDVDVGVKAATLVLQRSDDAILIPAYDNYNHRNQGKYVNWLSTKTTEVPNKYYELSTTRLVKQGEEIFSTYNLCEDCGGRKKFYGTPELFRDYGFVERYPQRWHVQTDRKYQFDVDQNPTTGQLEIVRWSKLPKDSDYRMDRLWIFFRKQIRRLRRLRNVVYASEDGTPASPESYHRPEIPREEWNSIWEFVNSNILAYTVALEYLEGYLHKHPKEYALLSHISGVTVNDTTIPAMAASTYSVAVDASHYDPLTMEGDDNAYELYTCDTTDAFNMVGFSTMEELETSYQDLLFSRKEETDDVCMTLDNIIQICANYRPHYHEYITHAAGRYVEKVKKVMFIGGGDSMLLHEALKYPSVEKVVGLELDQTVTRKSFKYFHTSPHFEDNRVEWWFGDATKSLLLLPEDYWGSFDLVLVDLSETAMSLSVTEELDVFDALSLLLNPQGVMVKNELYLEKFSKVFDYTLELYYESPVICSQVAILGSNNVDFFHAPVYDHGLPHNFLYKDLHKQDMRHDFMHDYRKNIASQAACALAIPEEPTEQKTAAGILEIVNAEQVGIQLDSSIVDKIQQVIKKHDLNVLSEHFVFQTGVVVFEDGYIAARIWPQHNYVGFDINMWGRTYLIPSLHQELTEAVKSPSKDVSAYKVVVGGIYGLDSWKSDQKLLGPKIKQLRNCGQDVVQGGSVDSDTAYAFSLKEIIPMTLSTEAVAVVVCTMPRDCASRKVLGQHANVKQVVVVEECAGLSSEADLRKLFVCEKKTQEALLLSLGNAKANLLVVDPYVSLEMIQIIQSIFETVHWRNLFLQQHSVIVAWSSDTAKEVYKREMLDRLRKAVGNDPVSRAEIVVQAGGNSYELGVVSTNNTRSSYEYDALEKRIQSKLSMDPYNAHVEVRMVHGSMFNYDENFEPTVFTLEDYDLSAAREQYENQKPLGRQNIIQFGEKETVRHGSATTNTLDVGEIGRLVSMGLNDIDVGLTVNKQLAIGDGGIVLSLGSTGNVIAVYDGKTSVVVNFFTFDERTGTPERFVKDFQGATRNKMEVKLRDDQPRGINRVINFPSDLNPPMEA